MTMEITKEEYEELKNKSILFEKIVKAIECDLEKSYSDKCEEVSKLVLENTELKNECDRVSKLLNERNKHIDTLRKKLNFNI